MTTPALRFALFTVVVGFACGGFGFRLGRGARADLKAEREAALAALPDEVPGSRLAGTCVAMVAPDVLQAELARALDAVGVVPSETRREAIRLPSAPPAPPAPPAPERVAAFDDARNAVDRVISQGRLDNEGAQELRRQLEGLDADGRYKLTARLVLALNQRKLKVEEARQLPF
jgi:hypothetical protein